MVKQGSLFRAPNKRLAKAQNLLVLKDSLRITYENVLYHVNFVAESEALPVSNASLFEFVIIVALQGMAEVIWRPGPLPSSLV